MPRKSATHYRNVRVETVAEHADALLREIRRQLGHVVAFTRDDCMALVREFEAVAFGSRYRAVCIAIAFLVEHGELIQKKFPDLCLPEREGEYVSEPVSTLYGSTIRRLVSTMPVKKPFIVIDVVQRWRTDPELTTDHKRRAVRNAIRLLVREGVCNRLNHFEFTVGGKR